MNIIELNIYQNTYRKKTINHFVNFFYAECDDEIAKANLKIELLKIVKNLQIQLKTLNNVTNIGEKFYTKIQNNPMCILIQVHKENEI